MGLPDVNVRKVKMKCVKCWPWLKEELTSQDPHTAETRRASSPAIPVFLPTYCT